MARLVFDKVGERFYETGVDRCVLYLQSSTGDYPLGVAWNGITEIQQNPSGAESNKQYADNIDYLNLISKETFGGSIASFTQPDEWAQCDGSVEPVAGIRMGQQTRKSFGLSYRTLIGNDIDGTDYGYKIHLIWNAKATPSERSYATMNDSPEALNPSWTIDTTPVSVPGYKPTSHMEIDSTKVDATKLAAFEDIILGSENSDPRLPTPAEVIDFFKESPVPPTPPTPEPTYEPVTPVGTENPHEEGWYERSGEEGSYVYTLTEDTTVDAEKTYYELVEPSEAQG